jgi:hypothetical protein
MGFSAEMVGVIDNTQQPARKADGIRINAKERSFLATFDLSLAGIDKTATGNNICFIKPRNHVVLGFEVVSSVSLATTALQFGIAGNTAKYADPKAYGVTADALVTYQKATAIAANANEVEEPIVMTNSVAALPGAGIIVVRMKTQAR